MKKWTKICLLAASLFATVAAPLTEASAGRRHHGYHGHGYHGSQYHHRPHHRHKHRSHRGDAVAAGIIGLGIGAIIGSAMAQPPQSPPPRVIYRDPPRPVHYSYEPWSPGWYDYCARRYRSFNPDTGTFRGYDGRDHFCNAP